VKFPATAAVGLSVLALISAGQTLSPGEVRISSRPYQPQSQLLRTESDVVRVDAVVRDKDGHIVPGLKAEDFAIFDNGKKQTIATFAVETHTPLAAGQAAAAAPVSPTTGQSEGTSASSPAANSPAQPRPRYVALYFDDVHTKWGDMKHVQQAAENFVRHGISQNDRIGLFTALSSETVDFTVDASRVLDAVAKLQSHARVFESSGCPRITAHDAYMIANFTDSEEYRTVLAAAKQCNCDASAYVDQTCHKLQETVVVTLGRQIWAPMRELSLNTLESIQGVVKYLASKPGEHVLLLASSGFLTGTLDREVDEVVDNALRAGIVINALDAKGLYTEDPAHGRIQNELSGGAANDALKHETESFASDLMSANAAMVDFAVGTGGRFFHDRNDLTAGYYSLAAAPETEYLLGFVPEKSNVAFHKLKVEVSAPGKFSVQARPGYFTPTKPVSVDPTPEEKIDAEVRGSEERSDFPLSVSEKPGAASNGGRELGIQTRVDIEKLPFQRQKDQYVDMLTIVAALFDAQGKMVAGKEAQMELALKPESFERFSKSGISGAMSLEVPPGAYRLRVVAQEAIHGEMSATSQNVQIQ